MLLIAFQVTNQHAHAKCNLSYGQVKPSASIQQKGNATTQSGTQIQTDYAAFGSCMHAYSCQMQIGYLHVYMLSMPDQLSVPGDARRSHQRRQSGSLPAMARPRRSSQPLRRMLEIRHVHIQKIRSPPAQRPEQQSQSSADVTDKLCVAQRTLRGYDIAKNFCVWVRRRGLKQPMVV